LIRKTDIFLNGESFSMDDFTDTAGNRTIMQFQKLVPGIKLTFNEKNSRSTITKFIQWKTFLITEQSLLSETEMVLNGLDTALISKNLFPHQNRYLNQLQLVYDDYRALYPFTL